MNVLKLPIILLLLTNAFGCSGLGAASTAASFLQPDKAGIDATVQLGKDVKNEEAIAAVKTNVQTASTNNVQAAEVTYNSTGLPWYVYAMVFMAWLIKSPSLRRRQRYNPYD